MCDIVALFNKEGWAEIEPYQILSFGSPQYTWNGLWFFLLCIFVLFLVNFRQANELLKFEFKPILSNKQDSLITKKPKETKVCVYHFLSYSSPDRKYLFRALDLHKEILMGISIANCVVV